MTDVVLSAQASHAASPSVMSPRIARALLLAVAAASVAASFYSIGPAAPARAGLDLTNLLRFMAALKAVLAIGVLAAVFWRLAVPVSPARLAVYLFASGLMTAGPGLIWGMDRIGLGALLLHGGLVATVLLLWRDRATSTRLRVAVEARSRKR